MLKVERGPFLEAGGGNSAYVVERRHRREAADPRSARSVSMPSRSRRARRTATRSSSPAPTPSTTRSACASRTRSSPMLQMTQILEGLPHRDGRDARAARLSISRSSEGEFVAVTGPVGLGQDDVPQHRRPARGADRRRVQARRRRRHASSTTRRARSCATRRSASSSRAST